MSRIAQAFCLLITLFIGTATACEAGVIKLVMVDSAGCGYCLAWKQEIRPAYPKTRVGQFAPLEIVDVGEIDSAPLKLKRPVVYTPTFLLTEQGRELTRLEGYPGEDFFWFHLDNMLTKFTNYNARAAAE